jgi:hypothetical protein
LFDTCERAAGCPPRRVTTREGIRPLGRASSSGIVAGETCSQTSDLRAVDCSAARDLEAWCLPNAHGEPRSVPSCWDCARSQKFDSCMKLDCCAALRKLAASCSGRAHALGRPTDRHGGRRTVVAFDVVVDEHRSALCLGSGANGRRGEVIKPRIHSWLPPAGVRACSHAFPSGRDLLDTVCAKRRSDDHVRRLSLRPRVVEVCGVWRAMDHEVAHCTLHPRDMRHDWPEQSTVRDERRVLVES